MIAIIGGTSGIGLETAIYIQALGHEVVVGGRKDPRKASLEFRALDVTDENQVELFFGSLRGPLEGLVYAAGTTFPKRSITEFTTSVFDQVMQTNATGLLLCLKYGYDKLVVSRGRVVVVNSIASRNSSRYSGIEYTMSKSALSGLVKQLAIDFAQDNVLINSVFPSMTETPLLSENVVQSKLDEMAKTIPLGRIANPLEISKAIAFLLLEENTYITGSGLDINGGQFLNG